MRFTHAFPTFEGQATRPVIAPLSLVKVGEKLFDVAIASDPMLIKSDDQKWKAPEFAVDWKSNEKVQKEFGWADPERELRVRTAIDSERRKARDEQLFAYERIVPNGIDWYCQIDLGAVPDPDRMKVEAQLRDLLANGLRALGKTKARAAIEVQSTIHAKHISQNTPRDGQWIITLQTPTLLCDPNEIAQSGLLTAYRNVWKQLSADSLDLKHFYAQQSLAGGRYLWQRFQSGKDYSPWLLTNAGSVFVLKPELGQETKAQDCIGQWMAQGLPLPNWAENRYGNHWTTCPFLPEGGYGEIAVNLEIHWAKYPQEGERYDIR